MLDKSSSSFSVIPSLLVAVFLGYAIYKVQFNFALVPLGFSYIFVKLGAPRTLAYSLVSLAYLGGAAAAVFATFPRRLLTRFALLVFMIAVFTLNTYSCHIFMADLIHALFSVPDAA